MVSFLRLGISSKFPELNETIFTVPRRMNLLPRRILHQSEILQGICAFSQNLFLRSYSSTTRQEFGRQFEEIVAQSLQKFSFDVAVCGGPKDRGIDFRGVWHLKSSPVNVVGQCRRYKKRLGPRHVRELEGTLTHEVKGTLGIIVTECGYSKDAYEVFMGSLYPIALTTLKGYSDGLLQWYSNQWSDERSSGKNQDIAEGDSLKMADYGLTDRPLPGDDEITDAGLDNNFAESENQEMHLNYHCQYSVEDESEASYSSFNQEDITCNNKVDSDFRTSVMDNRSQRHDSTAITNDVKQLTTSDISEIGTGVFTMFELNPAARRLLPNVVVGMKYRRHNSKAPELFVNEDDSFISVTK